MKLNDSSIKKLKDVHPDLQRVIYRAAEISPLKFIVTEGLRSLERQKKLLSMGATTTLRSRHITGHAVDLAVWMDDGDGITENGEIRWDWILYPKLDKALQEASAIEKVPVEWGGSWLKFKDGCHWQLPWRLYP